MQADLERLKVRVVIPHYCSDQGVAQHYGSTRPGNRDKRIVALGRTLGALRALTLQAGINDYIFNHTPEPGPAPLPQFQQPASQARPIDLEVLVCVTGDAWLEGALRAFARTFRGVRLELTNPIELGLDARDLLLKTDPVPDLSLYMEDDLVIHDPYFFEKQFWFIKRANDQAVLMPHRYELDLDDEGVSRRLFVDGFIEEPASALFPWQPLENAAQGMFRNEPVSFDLAKNPHSGCFVLSARQVHQLRHQGVPAQQWVGPLETAATFTPAHCFPVYKPSLSCRDFLTIEHAHHSFSAYFDSAFNSPSDLS